MEISLHSAVHLSTSNAFTQGSKTINQKRNQAPNVLAKHPHQLTRHNPFTGHIFNTEIGDTYN